METRRSYVPPGAITLLGSARAPAETGGLYVTKTDPLPS